MLALNETCTASTGIALLMGVGFFGSLSTFSTFAELLNELRAGQALTPWCLRSLRSGRVCWPRPQLRTGDPCLRTNPAFNWNWQELLLVGLGAVPGALLRWQLALHLGDQNLLVNVLGAALLLSAGLSAAPRRQLLLGIGFCGSLTTFSSWMLGAMKYLSSGDCRRFGFDRADPRAGAWRRSPWFQPGAPTRRQSRLNRRLRGLRG